MSIADLNQAFELIEKNKALVDFDGPKPLELIESAESALGMKFPRTYKLFLERLGCGDINGIEFYGVIKDDFENSSVPDAIWLTLEKRRNSGLAASLVLIAETGEGSYYAINVEEINDDGECPIVEWNPGSPLISKIADDFGAFMMAKIQNVIS